MIIVHRWYIGGIFCYIYIKGVADRNKTGEGDGSFGMRYDADGLCIVPINLLNVHVYRSIAGLALEDSLGVWNLCCYSCSVLIS